LLREHRTICIEKDYFNKPGFGLPDG